VHSHVFCQVYFDRVPPRRAEAREGGVIVLIWSKRVIPFANRLSAQSASFVPSGPSPVEACLVWCRTWGLAMLSTQSCQRDPIEPDGDSLLGRAEVVRCVLGPSKMRRVTDACSGRIRGPCRGLCFLAPLDTACGMDGLRAVEWGQSFSDRRDLK
jgi:hypothetical protein